MKKSQYYVPLLLVAILGISAACSPYHARRLAYQALRAEDCRINNLEEFCQRTYALEFSEYERLRREYLRDKQDETWRATPVDHQQTADQQQI